MFYAVDIQNLVRQGASGALAGDPTIPYRPSRLLLLRRSLRVRRMLGRPRSSPSCSAAERCLADQHTA